MAKKNNNQSLDIMSAGYAFGTLWGAIMLILGISAMISGKGMVEVLYIGSWYKGFAPNLVGTLIGTAWGFVDGFVGGILTAWLYNFYLNKRK